MIDALGSMKMSQRLRKLMKDAGVQGHALPPDPPDRHRPAQQADAPQAGDLRRQGSLHLRPRRLQRCGRGTGRTRSTGATPACAWRAGGQRRAGGLRPALGRGDAGGAGRREVFPAPRAGRRPRVHVLAGAPLGGVSDLELMFKMAHRLGAEGAADPEPLLHPRRGDGEAPEAGREPRRGGQDHGPRHGHRQPDRAPRRPSPLRARCWPPACASSSTRTHADPPEDHDHRRHLVARRLDQPRLPLLRHQRGGRGRASSTKGSPPSSRTPSRRT